MSAARMIPSICPANAPDGERRIFEMLRDDPGASGWIVLHSLDLARHVKQVQGEADFVVIVPSEGVIVLEIKSHHYVKYDERGWWLGGASTPEARGPFKQAAEAMHSIRTFLNEKGNAARLVPFVSAVAFTDTNFTTQSIEWHPWQVLDHQKLSANPISTNLLRIIRAAKAHFAKKGLSWFRGSSPLSQETASAIANSLRPRFEFMANPQLQLQHLKENLLRCTEQQFRVLDSLADNDRLLVYGPAGTGKTCLAVEALRRERQARPDSRCALFCFNRLLGEELEKACSAVAPGAKVIHLHKWMLGLANVKPTPAQAAEADFWSKQLPQKAADVLLDTGDTQAYLDLLVLDEAQDLFLDPYLDIFDLLLKGGLAEGRWIFFGDFDRQDLFAKGSVKPKDFRNKRTPKGCGTCRLDVNCRNTLEISQYVTMLGRLDPPYSSALRGDSRHDPELSFYGDDASQAGLAIAALDSLLGDGFKVDDIVILSPLGKKALAAELASRPPWRDRLAPLGNAKGKIRYGTVHAFKGLEAPAVILTDVDDLDTAEQQDLFYVGMSRALHRLHVLAHDDTRETIREMLE